MWYPKKFNGDGSGSGNDLEDVKDLGLHKGLVIFYLIFGDW